MFAWINWADVQGNLAASNPGFPFQVLSCSFGEKSDISPKLQEKTWNKSFGIKAKDFIAHTVDYLGSICRLFNLDDWDTRLFHMLWRSNVSVCPVSHSSLHTVAASTVGEHWRTLGMQPAPPVSNEARTYRPMGGNTLLLQCQAWNVPWKITGAYIMKIMSLISCIYWGDMQSHKYKLV